MWRFVQDEGKFFLILVMLSSTVGVCYYEYQQYMVGYQLAPQVSQPKITMNTAGEQSKIGEPQVVYVQGQNKTTQEIIYVPKETEVKTGSLEKTDVQFETKQGKIHVKVNGKDFEVPADVQENAKFEKGKLVMTQQSEMSINITTPKPAINLGLGWSRDGLAVQANGPLVKNVSWWVYGDKKNVAAGLEFPIMK